MLLKDFVSDTLASGIAAGALSMTLSDASEFPSPSAGTNTGYYFVGVWSSDTGNGGYASPQAAWEAGTPEFETMLVTAKSGNVLTVERGFGVTSDIAHNTGGETYTVAILADAQNVGQQWAINVKSFGATGNGTTDDSTKVARAMTAGEVLSLPIYFPAGTYLCTWDGTNSQGHVRLFGEGPDCIISNNNQSRVFRDMQNGNEFHAEGVHFVTWGIICNLNDLAADETVAKAVFKNCTFSDVNTGIGWRTTKPDGAKLTYGEISNCEIIRPDDAFVNIIGDIDRFVFANNHVRDANATGSATLISFGREAPTEQDGWNNIQIVDNVFANNTIQSAATSELIVVYGQRCTISGNIINGITGSGTLSIAVSTRCRYSTITSNTISDTASSAIGIANSGDQRGDTTAVNAYGCTISNNVIDQNDGTYGIWVMSEETSVVGNYIEDANVGIRIGNVSGGPYMCVSVVANNIKRVTAASGSTGIECVDVGSNFQIHGNVVASYEKAINIDAAGRNYTTQAMSITNNMITEFSSQGINIDAGTGTSSFSRIIVSGNNVYTSLTSTTAFRTDGAGGTSINRMSVMGNIFFASTLINFVKQPSFSGFTQETGDSTPNSNITAEIGTIGVANNAGTAVLLLKETGDHTNTGWKTVTIS